LKMAACCRHPRHSALICHTLAPLLSPQLLSP